MDARDVGCAHCGEQAPAEATVCRACGASLLVEVALRGAAPAERERFLAARAVAALGPPAPPFALVRQALERPGARVVTGVSRAFAARVVEALAQQGVASLARQVAPPTAPGVTAVDRRPRSSLAVVAVLGLGAVALVAAGVALWRGPLADVLAQVDARRPPRGSPDEGLRTQDIARAALPATASIRCGNAVGSGFFVTPEMLLTNAHVACAPGATQQVTLHDGRELAGVTLKEDETLDVASVRVVGANAPALPLGDATALDVGDRVVFVGSPRGLAFTLHEGRVSYVGREHLGVGYLQFDASVNPGNSGGPLLDRRGRVVGIVSMKVTDAEGLGLALPLPYADAFLVREPADGERERWAEQLAAVKRAEERSMAEFDVQPDRPALVSAGATPQGQAFVVLLARAPTQPDRQRHALVASGKAGVWCRMDADFTHWKPLVQQLYKTDDVDPGLRRYLSKKPFARELFLGAARLPVEHCSRPPEGEVRLQLGTAPDGARALTLPPEVVQAARRADPGAQLALGWSAGAGAPRSDVTVPAHTRPSVPPGPKPSDEWYWRSRFRDAQSAITRAEEEVRTYQRYALEPGYSAGARWRREAVDRARQALDELEREASRKSVPRAWRN